MGAGEYQLVQLAGGAWSVRSERHAETFHPVVGPAAEAAALYVHQLQLRERVAAGSEPFVIWDVGLGAGGNAFTVLAATRDLPCSLELVSFDQSTAPLQFALAHTECLTYLRGYEPAAKQMLESPTNTTSFMDGSRVVSWRTVLGDFPTWTASPAAATVPKPHAILFDAFSPATNPEMWTLPLFERLFALLDPSRPCALPTYSRSTMLRATLLLAGFYVGTGHATGEKDQTTLAANTLSLVDTPLDDSWLRRAQRSTSAEPLRTPHYRQARLSPETWDRLQRHPQFAPFIPAVTRNPA